jgi:hypothetical protein
MILIAWQCTPIRVAIIVYPLSSLPLLHWLSRQEDLEPVSGGLWSTAFMHAEVTFRDNLMPFRRLGAPLLDLTRRKAVSGPCEKVSGRFFLMDECGSQWTGFLDTLVWVAGHCRTIAARIWVHGVTMSALDDAKPARRGTEWPAWVWACRPLPPPPSQGEYMLSPLSPLAPLPSSLHRINQLSY